MELSSSRLYGHDWRDSDSVAVESCDHFVRNRLGLDGDLDRLCERPIGEYGLNARNDRRNDDASLWSDAVDLLAYSRDNGEVHGKIAGKNSGDSGRVKIVQLGELFGIERLVEHLLDGVLSGFQLVLLPVLAIV